MNDPLAEKIVNKIKAFKVPEPPLDASITTLFIGGVDQDITQADLEKEFLPFGKT